jgi:peptide/nickel transport system permease protein
VSATAPPPAGASEDLRVEVASQWQLVWWKFRRHKLALVSLVVIVIVYLVAAFAEFIAPYGAERNDARYPLVGPQRVHWVDRSQGRLRIGPYVYGLKVEINRESLRREFADDRSVRIPLAIFGVGEPYRLWGLFPMRRHLVTPATPGEPMFLLGTDRLGRDVASRVVHGTRVSMSVGLIGVTISLVLGIVLGGISGYYGGVPDNIIQRVIEFIRSIPTIPLWMGLAAAIPIKWPPLRVYFAITLILSLIAWTGLARVVRGRFLALRTDDFVLAARLDGCTEMRIILRHMVPSFLSHIIASITLAIPNMILSETALSFIGIGLRPPVVSWGVLLREAQNIRSVATAPWLLFVPAVPVLISVLSLNFLGDGLRDAADPYN